LWCKVYANQQTYTLGFIFSSATIAPGEEGNRHHSLLCQLSDASAPGDIMIAIRKITIRNKKYQNIKNINY